MGWLYDFIDWLEERGWDIPFFGLLFIILVLIVVYLFMGAIPAWPCENGRQICKLWPWG